MERKLTIGKNFRKSLSIFFRTTSGMTGEGKKIADGPYEEGGNPIIYLLSKAFPCNKGLPYAS